VAVSRLNVRIFDAQGREVWAGQPVLDAQHQTTLQLQHLSPGVYAVQAQDGQRVYRQSIVRQ